MSIECMIVDDEPLAVRVIIKYLEKLPNMHLKATAHNAFEALEKLNQHNIDLIFLDIDMPEINGMDLITSMRKKPAFIFVTAFREFAADAFEVDAIDYLVKPVSFPRFLKAVNKFQANINEKNKAGSVTIQIRADRKTHNIDAGKIMLVEGLKDYVKVFCDEEEVYITHKTMTAMEKLLKPMGFIRCHKSYLVPISRIKAFRTDSLELEGKQIPVGKSYRKKVMEILAP